MKLPRLLPIPGLAVGCLTVAGCGRDAPEMVPTRGKVTLNGGRWPRPGALFFAPLKPAEGFPRRPGVGQFDTDGIFTVTSRDPGDGLRCSTRNACPATGNTPTRPT